MQDLNRKREAHRFVRHICLSLSLLTSVGIANADPNENVMKAHFESLDLCAARDFNRAQVDPARILDLDDKAKFRALRGDRLTVDDVELEDDGATVKLVFQSKSTHGDPEWRSPMPGWDKMVLAAIKPIVRPCEEVGAEIEAAGDMVAKGKCFNWWRDILL